MKIVAKLLAALVLLIVLILRLGDDTARIASKLPAAAGRTADSAAESAAAERMAAALGRAPMAKDAHDVYEHVRKSREPETFAAAGELLREAALVKRFCHLVMDGTPDPVRRYQTELETIGRFRGLNRKNLDFLAGNTLHRSLERIAQSLLFKYTLERTLGTPGYDLETLKQRHPLAAGLFPWGERVTEEFASQVARQAQDAASGDGGIDVRMVVLPSKELKLGCDVAS